MHYLTQIMAIPNPGLSGLRQLVVHSMLDSLSKSLNIEPLPQANTFQEVTTSSGANTDIVTVEYKDVLEEKIIDIEEDYKFSRSTFRNIITKGSLAIDEINKLAKALDAPRAYEVLAIMMKTVSETTKDLYDLQAKSKALNVQTNHCLLYTSPSPRDRQKSRMP